MVAILVIFGLPLGGLVIRFALRPLVQDIANAIRSNSPASGDPAQIESLNRRLERMEQSLLEQEALTTRLLEVQEFDRKLGTGRREDPELREP